MTQIILSPITASISELKTNPMKIMESGEGEPVAILNRNKPAFYCVPADLYENMLEMLDDMELIRIIKSRKDAKEIAVDINEI